MTDAVVIEPLATVPIYIEQPSIPGSVHIIALQSLPGPFGPKSLATTVMAIIVDGGGAVIMPGVKADLPIDWNGRVVGWQLIGDLAGNAVVDIKKGDPVHGVPFASITNGNKPTMTAVAAAEGDAVGWNSELSEGDVLRYEVITLNTVRRMTVALFVERD